MRIMGYGPIPDIEPQHAHDWRARVPHGSKLRGRPLRAEGSAVRRVCAVNEVHDAITADGLVSPGPSTEWPRRKKGRKKNNKA